ncbi:hypothetical protein GF337_17735 [candidate division KSB1 bacterium]|nr:hypothetical protein [candidate division KSB1 bacterium]
MRSNAKEILEFVIDQEGKLNSILGKIDKRNLSKSLKKPIEDLQRTSSKNIKLLEKINNELIENIKDIEIDNIVVEDFRIDDSHVDSFDKTTALIFIMKTLDNSMELFSKINKHTDEVLLLKAFEGLISEKQRLKEKISRIYDQSIMNG